MADHLKSLPVVGALVVAELSDVTVLLSSRVEQKPNAKVRSNRWSRLPSTPQKTEQAHIIV